MWEFFNSTAGGASILAGILGIVTLVNGWQASKTRRRQGEILKGQGETMERMDASTKALLKEMGDSTKALLAQMEANAVTRHGAVMDKLEGRDT